MGFTLKVANGRKLREAISLAPRLQPGDPEASPTLDQEKTSMDHRAKAAMLMRLLPSRQLVDI
jgi:hypothetical protein